MKTTMTFEETSGGSATTGGDESTRNFVNDEDRRDRTTYARARSGRTRFQFHETTIPPRAKQFLSQISGA